MENDRKIKNIPSEELAEDPNYVAYKAQEAELKEKYMGKWVAFHEGNLVAVEDNRETLFAKIRETGNTGFMYKEIVPVERVIRIRGPRRAKS